MPGFTARVAFFDLDRTVLAINSGPRWFRRQRRTGQVTLSQALVVVGTYSLYSVGLMHADWILHASARALQGTEEEELAGALRVFWREEILHHVRPGARAAIAAHRARGDHTMLLTASHDHLAQAVARDLGLDEAKGSRFLVDGGRFTGQLQLPPCSGPGKVAHAEQAARAAGAHLRDCTFYSDSYSDLALLEAVGTAVAVNPDPRLAREARRRGWSCVDWGRPETCSS